MSIYQEYKAGTLDLLSSDYTRPEENSSEMKNVLFVGSVEDPAIEKRFGIKRRAKTGPIFGAVSFQNVVNARPDGAKEKVGFFQDGIRREIDAKIVVSYSGPASTATLSLSFDPSVSAFRLVIIAGGSTLIDQLLGVGYDEVSPYTMANLQAALAVIPNISAVLTGSGSIPAAFSQNEYLFDLKAEACSLIAHEWQNIETLAFDDGLGNKRGEMWAQLAWIDQDEYEPCSNTELNNVLYFVFSGYVFKYDGQSAWRAGQPNPAVTLVSAAGGTLPAGTYNYVVRTRQVDRVGNIIYGPWEYKSITIIANRAIEISVASPGGLDSKRFVCSTNMVSASNVIPYSSNTLNVGDVVSVWDRQTNTLVDSYVVSINTGTSEITIEAAVRMNAGDGGSNGLSVEIGRQKQGGTLYYLVAERPYRFLSASLYEWSDNAADSTLTQELIEPEFDFGRPPMCRYIAVYNNGLVVGGSPLSYNLRYSLSLGGPGIDPELHNSVQFADYEFVEGWPTDGSYQVKVDTVAGDGIRGMHEIGTSLIVIKDRATARLSGDPTQLDIRVDWLSKEVGTLAGQTIQEVNGQLFFLSNRGFASVIESAAPSEKIGSPIKPIILQDNLTYPKKLRFRAGHTALLSERQLYIAYLPAYAPKAQQPQDFVYLLNGGDGSFVQRIDFRRPFDIGEGRTFVYDYLRGRWSEWKINALGALVEHMNRLALSEGRYSALSSSVENGSFEEQIGNFGVMYEDHDQPLSFLDGTAWYNGGKPKIDKHLPRISISSVPTTVDNIPTLQIAQQVNFLREDQVTIEVELYDQASPFQVVAQEQLLDGKFKSTRFLFKNDEHNRNVQIEGWQVEVDAPYVSELKR